MQIPALGGYSLIIKRKHGKFQALKRLAAGEVVKMPYAQLLLNEGPEAVNEVLIAAFTLDY
jgi:hypothetical protein